MPTLKVINREGVTSDVEASNGISIMENIRDLDASVDAICGGFCSCATCHVLVDPEWAAKLPPRSGEELALVRDVSIFDPDRSRLSCQLIMSDDCDGLTLTVAPEEF